MPQDEPQQVDGIENEWDRFKCEALWASYETYVDLIESVLRRLIQQLPRCTDLDHEIDLPFLIY